MATRYQFSEDEIAEIANARKITRSKQTDRRLKALEMRAEGKKSSEIAEACEYHPSYVSMLVKKYRTGGLEAIVGNHYHGNRRNLSFEEEAAILEPFRKQAQDGKMVSISEIEKRYREAVGHSIGTSQIYYVLRRHGWRKVMPRSRHPKKASEEVIETSKKLTHESVN